MGSGGARRFAAVAAALVLVVSVSADQNVSTQSETDFDALLTTAQAACRSGGGVITGDGIASLARAFFYAGTRL